MNIATYQIDDTNPNATIKNDHQAHQTLVQQTGYNHTANNDQLKKADDLIGSLADVELV